jgi:hypothetical protein
MGAEPDSLPVSESNRLNHLSCRTSAPFPFAEPSAFPSIVAASRAASFSTPKAFGARNDNLWAVRMETRRASAHVEIFPFGPLFLNLSYP